MSQTPQGVMIPDGYSISGAKDVLALKPDGSAVPVREYLSGLQKDVQDLRAVLQYINGKRTEAIDSACAVRRMIEQMPAESSAALKVEIERLIGLISELEGLKA